MLISEWNISLTRPCKPFDPRARSYISGTTCNLSCDGMLLRLHRTSSLHVGDRVYVGISRKRQQVLLVSATERADANATHRAYPTRIGASIARRSGDATLPADDGVAQIRRPTP